MLENGNRSALRLALAEARRRWHSEEVHYGFHLEFTRLAPVPDPPLPLTVRELADGDLDSLLDPTRADGSPDELRAVFIRRLLAESALPTCYVGITADGRPCCMCWLVRSRDNGAFQAYYGTGFRPLDPGTVLCDEIYTHPDYRGYRLMRYLTLYLLALAAREGARRGLAFIRKENTRSLVAAAGIGWEPFTVRVVRWRWFRRHVTESPLQPGDLPAARGRSRPAAGRPPARRAACS